MDTLQDTSRKESGGGCCPHRTGITVPRELHHTNGPKNLLHNFIRETVYLKKCRTGSVQLDLHMFLEHRVRSGQMKMMHYKVSLPTTFRSFEQAQCTAL